MRKFDTGELGEGEVVEMEFEKRVVDYCQLAAIDAVAKKIMDSHRVHIIDGFSSAGVDKIADSGAELERRIVNRTKVNIGELDKICKKKNIEIGLRYYIIRPKNSNIPKKVLEGLDKYFTLEEVTEADTKDIRSALDTGLITQKDYDKVIEISSSSSLYPRLDTEARKDVIK